ncbi:MAG TPA: hypothetical protein PLH98_20535 [Ruminococcus flavefaciens]|nr:hypothetical protein [Ruminococcus flavefaciens]
MLLATPCSLGSVDGIYTDLQCNDAAFYSEAAYELGFKDGAKLMIDVMK